MSISTRANGFAGLRSVKLGLAPEQCQAILGHGIMCCQAALHLPPLPVLLLVCSMYGDLPKSSWVRVFCVQELGHVFRSIWWLSHSNYSHFRGSSFWSCSWFLGTAELGWNCDLAEGSGVSGTSRVNFMGRWWWSPWADPGCPAVHCANCGYIAPFRAWLDCTAQDFRLSSCKKWRLELQSVRRHLSSCLERRNSSCTQ